MPNENDSNTPPTDREWKPPLPPRPVAQPAPHQRELREQPENGTDNKENETVKQLEKDIRAGEHWVIRIGAAGVIMNVIIALIYYGQLTQMRKATAASEKAATAAANAADTGDKTLKEIRSGAADTQKLIEAAGKQADAAKRSAQAASDFATQAKGINVQTQAAVQQFGRIAGVSEKALNASAEATNLDQRPWVGVRSEVIRFVPGEPFKVQILFVNTGKTPAFYAKICKNMQVFPARFDPPPSDITGMFCDNAGAIAPQAPFPLNGDDIPERHVSKEYDAITHGTKFLYVWGYITYNVHNPPSNQLISPYTKFCFVYDHISAGLTLCEYGNDMF